MKITLFPKTPMKRSLAPVRPFDRILEFVTLCLSVALLVCTLVFYLKSPDTVGTHFNGSGMANAFGSRSAFWNIGLTGLVITGMLVLAAYRPSLINRPIAVRPKSLPRQHQLMGEMARLIAVDISVMFITIECAMYSTTPSSPQVPPPLCLVMLFTVAVLLGLSIVYSWRIYRA
jgi:uncharacterized membrane protein